MTVKFVVIIGLLLLIGCANETESILTEAESGQTFSYLIGRTFYVVLSSNITTGYSWSCKLTPEGFLDTTYQSEFHPNSNLPGSNGFEWFKFIVVSAGQTEMQFEYKRQWDPTSVATKEAYYIVVTQ
jgi:predicted secreted protein